MDNSLDSVNDSIPPLSVLQETPDPFNNINQNLRQNENEQNSSEKKFNQSWRNMDYPKSSTDDLLLISSVSACNVTPDQENQIYGQSIEDGNGSLQISKSNQLKKMQRKYKSSRTHYPIMGDAKLNEAINPWKPTHLKGTVKINDKERESEELLKSFRCLLNKITEENFEILVKEINEDQKYMIDSPEKLSAIVKLVFEKAIFEPIYAPTYAKLCQAVSTVHLVNEVVAAQKKTNPWKLYLISHCQKEFERLKLDDVIFKGLQESINNANDPLEIENYEDLYFKIRQRANGTVKFIGELYKMKMLSANIMVKCIDVLIKPVTEENIERLCKLLTTIGEKLESEIKSKSDMDKYMHQLSEIRNLSIFSTQRVKFDIMNVIDLRNSGWKQRKIARMWEAKPQKFNDLLEQNNDNRQRSQRSFDNDGFRVNNSKQIDFNKINIPKTNSNAGPQRNFFQNSQKPASQMQPPPTKISNPFTNLLQTGSIGHKSRKDGKDSSYARANNKEKQKARMTLPVVAKSVENDDFFMIDLTDNEEKDLRLFKDKMQQVFKAKITFDMMITDLKNIKFTKNILGQIFTDLFGKKSCEREELIEQIGKISQNGLITKVMTADALKLVFKSIPSIICDVPLAYVYFSEYCAYFYENGLITWIDIFK